MLSDHHMDLDRHGISLRVFAGTWAFWASDAFTRSSLDVAAAADARAIAVTFGGLCTSRPICSKMRGEVVEAKARQLKDRVRCLVRIR